VLCERHEELAIDHQEGDYCPVCSEFVCGECCVALNEQAGREAKSELNSEMSESASDERKLLFSDNDECKDDTQLLCGGCGPDGWPRKCAIAHAAAARRSGAPSSPPHTIPESPPRTGTPTAHATTPARGSPAHSPPSSSPVRSPAGQRLPRKRSEGDAMGWFVMTAAAVVAVTVFAVGVQAVLGAVEQVGQDG
jgi:hypothetical protein